MTDPKKSMTEAELDKRLDELKAEPGETVTAKEAQGKPAAPPEEPEEKSILERAVDRVLPQPAPPDPPIVLLPLDQSLLMEIHTELVEAKGRYNINYIGDALAKLILHLAENSEGE